MNQIKAIETHYKGYRFRSRLEARWAVFFDEAGIEYQYELQGYEVCGVRYLPDFYLPKSKTWVEVKGDETALKAGFEKLAIVLDFESPLPGLHDSYGSNSGLLILGEIPYVESFGIFCHPLIQHSKGLLRAWATFIPDFGIRHISQNILTELCSIELQAGLESSADYWTTKHVFIATPRAWSRINNAYKAARSARFEHGENGARVA
jgi:hypothetical protein